ESENIDLSQDNMALQKLREEVEKAKVELSFSDRAELNIPFISADETGPKHLNMEIYKNDFEDLIEEFVEETISLTTKTLKDANLTAEDIDKVILVGGSTRVPFIQKEVEKVLGKDITKGVNPDECVALGAAIQASILSGETHDMVLVDVTPLSLGIEIEGGVFVPVIERNTTIPVTASKLFTTITDFQKSVEIHVYQGERLRCQDNVSLGQCHLTGIRRAKKGEPRIEVVFSLDVDGILNVSARDLDTGNIQKVKITNTTSLSQDKIAKLIDEAQKHKQKDVENIKSEGIKSQFIAQYNLFKELYDKHLDEIDENLQKEVKKVRKNIDKKLKSFSLEDFEEQIEKVEFLTGEMMAVCSQDREEVEI
ncbi:MAG: Hsp70 family protein, partial [Spirochaetota bacterium]|nr:Hsp70 family protein [Spirochaetota bacterium]